MTRLTLLIAFFLAGASVRSATIQTIAGTGVAGYAGDGGPALKAQLNNPYGLVIGPDGNLYVCDMSNHVIRRIGKDGTISTMAGSGKKGYSGDNGSPVKAELNEPYEVRFDSQGVMFFVEMQNNLVRSVGRDGIITTVAGSGQKGFKGDGGPAREAEFNQPHSIQLDSKGNLFVCDIANNRIRKMDLSAKTISTFARTGEKKKAEDGAHLPSVPLNGPRAIDFDREGNMWLALREGNAIYKINMKEGTIHHVAGTGKTGFSGNGGPAKEATLSGPKGISVGPDGNVYFTDTESHSIRMIDTKRGTVELIAGTGERGDGPDGDPLKCKLSRPHGIFVAKNGEIYVGDSENHRVRVIRR
jgi:streptogramin lyase